MNIDNRCTCLDLAKIESGAPMLFNCSYNKLTWLELVIQSKTSSWSAGGKIDLQDRSWVVGSIPTLVRVFLCP